MSTRRFDQKASSGLRESCRVGWRSFGDEVAFVSNFVSLFDVSFFFLSFFSLSLFFLFRLFLLSPQIRRR